MRLIDADELIKRMRKWMPKDPCGREQTVEEVVATDIAASVFMEIEETPTAFDKEKVILELSKKRYEAFKMRDDENTSCTTELKSFWHSRLEAYTLAIEVIEKGGIE